MLNPARAVGTMIVIGVVLAGLVLWNGWKHPPVASMPPTSHVAPEIAGSEPWLNSTPLSLAALQGKVVLIEFWTYGCINCVRTLPSVRQWHDRYAAQGLVVIGVHTPEFAAEHEPDNVRAAAARLGVTWPIILDNEYRIWHAYGNNYWPHLFLIDRHGQIVYHYIGEGAYDETEQQIRHALAAP